MVKHTFSFPSKTLNCIVFSEALDLLKRLLFSTAVSTTRGTLGAGKIEWAFFSEELLVLYLAETYPCCVTSYSVGTWESSKKTEKMLYMHDVAGWLQELLIRLLCKSTLFLKVLTTTWLVPIHPIPSWDCNDLFAVSSLSRTLNLQMLYLISSTMMFSTLWLFGWPACFLGHGE